ncbi:MAG TPA: hypothetical protein VHL81_07390, partial [Gemmatimonadales bacterium]|nr:hypothetical protein [Gemmatimonadales bacterium]
IRQTALFDPVGLGGLLYWYGLWAIHQLVFAGMLRSIARAARDLPAGSESEPGVMARRPDRKRRRVTPFAW